MTTFDDFNRFSLEVEPDELDEEDRLPTINKFSEIHEQNKSVLDELSDEHDELDAKFTETVEEKEQVEDELTAFKEKLAEHGDETTKLSYDELMAFNLPRLAEIVGFELSDADVTLDDEDGGKFDEDNRSNAGKREEEEGADAKYASELVNGIPGVMSED